MQPYFCRAVIFQYALYFVPQLRPVIFIRTVLRRVCLSGGASEPMCSAEVKSGSLGETFLAIWRIDVTGLSGPRGQIQAASHTNCFCGREHQESNLSVLKRFLFSTPSPPFNNPICL